MKCLELNPQFHEISLYAEDIHDDVATVHFSLRGTAGEICLSSKEAERIGKWFLSLSAESKKVKANG